MNNRTNKKANKATRPLTIEEYTEIINLMMSGFEYRINGRKKRFRPNERIALILQTQATTGLRIGDVLELRLNNFKNNNLEIIEGKTNKLQYREVNKELVNRLYRYAIDNDIKKDDKLFNIGVRAVQKQLKIVVDYLGLKNISTHSFRKLYATVIYNNTKNIELVRELLNHESIATTQNYIRLSQEEINNASREMNLLIDDIN